MTLKYQINNTLEVQRPLNKRLVKKHCHKILAEGTKTLELFFPEITKGEVDITSDFLKEYAYAYEVLSKRLAESTSLLTRLKIKNSQEYQSNNFREQRTARGIMWHYYDATSKELQNYAENSLQEKDIYTILNTIWARQEELI